MLKIDNLTITTHKGRVLLSDFSFVLNDNDKIALIGEEGNGKSTILKIIAGIDVSDYVSYTGDIYSDGNYLAIQDEVERIMEDNEFIRVGCSPDMYEEDTGLYHKTIEFEKERMR